MTLYEWDEAKRLANLGKHGLDLIDGVMVHESPHKLALPSKRQGEYRVQALAYVSSHSAVLSLTYAERGEVVRFISLRYASKSERKDYHEWIENRQSDR